MKQLLGWLTLCIIGCTTSTAQTTLQLDSTVLEVSTLLDDLHVPWEILWGPDDWIWLTERNGRISRVDPETGTHQILHSLFDCYEYSESGLLGMVLHPNFNEFPHVFIVYNYYDDGNREKLVRYTYNDGSLTAPTTLLENITASSGGNHSGSRLLILPDETLLMTVGDYYNSMIAQDLNAINGKIIRLNLDGSVPADNPIPGSYLYSWGHRNAQGLVLAPNGLLYSSEHGPSNDDEFNIIEANNNYGWPNVEGFCNTSSETNFCNNNNVIEPLAAWTPTLAVCGIDYYNHLAIPEWYGSVLMCNLKQPSFLQLRFNQEGTEIIEERNISTFDFGRLRDVCVAPDGRVFIATSNQDGRAPGWSDFPLPNDDRIIALKNAAYQPVMPVATFDYNTECLTVQFDNTSVDADTYFWNFGNGYTSSLASPTQIYFEPGTYTVQLIASNAYSSDTTSINLSLDCSNGISPSDEPTYKLYPNPCNDFVQISFPQSLDGASLQLIDIKGNVMYHTTLSESLVYLFNTRQFSTGIYYTKITHKNKTTVKKLVIN